MGIRAKPRNKAALVGLLTGALFAVSVFWLKRPADLSFGTTRNNSEGTTAISSGAVTEAPALNDAKIPQAVGELRPEEVIDDLDCRMLAGRARRAIPLWS